MFEVKFKTQSSINLNEIPFNFLNKFCTDLNFACKNKNIKTNAKKLIVM